MNSSSRRPSSTTKLPLLFYTLFCFGLGFSYIWMAYTGYPQAEPDSLWFPPAAVSYHQGTGLLNQLHEGAQGYDLSGQKRFLFYPPGFPLFLSGLMFEPTGRGALVGIAFLNAASLALSAILIYKVLMRDAMFLDASRLGMACLGLLALSTYFSSFNLGRPDFLATFLILILVLVQWKLKGGWREILNFSLLGFLAFVHPVAALFSSCLLGIYYSWNKPWPIWGLPLGLIYVGGLIVFILAMAMSPHGFHDAMGGILLHSRATLVHGTSHGWFKYWIVHSYASGYGLLFMVALAISFAWYWRERQRIASRCGVLWFVLILLALIQHFVAIAWDRSYNLWLLSPLFVAILFGLLADPEWREKKFIKRAISLLLIANAFGYLHLIVLFGFYLENGYPLSEARRDFQKIAQEKSGLIGVSKSLWILSEDYQRMRSFGLNPAHLKCSPDMIFLQQRYSQCSIPPKLAGYELIRHNFTTEKPVLWGIPLSPTMPGYFYAFYKRDDKLGAAVSSQD